MIDVSALAVAHLLEQGRLARERAGCHDIDPFNAVRINNAPGRLGRIAQALAGWGVSALSRLANPRLKPRVADR